MEMFIHKCTVQCANTNQPYKAYQGQPNQSLCSSDNKTCCEACNNCNFLIKASSSIKHHILVIERKKKMKKNVDIFLM